MAIESSPRPIRWKELYFAAMLESDRSKLPPMVDNALNAVLDEIEIVTEPTAELDELNSALNILRSRRKRVAKEKAGETAVSKRPRAA
jgi:hypothetical protein